MTFLCRDYRQTGGGHLIGPTLYIQAAATAAVLGIGKVEKDAVASYHKFRATMKSTRFRIVSSGGAAGFSPTKR